MKKNIIPLFLGFLFLTFLSFNSTSAHAAVRGFDDVPQDHWANYDILALRELGISDGIGGNIFGLGSEITRAQFVTFLANLLEWDIDNVSTLGSFTDNMDTSKWYYKYIEAGVYNGAVYTDTETFRPDAPVTRGEMAVMIVNALGYGEATERLDFLESPFADVTQYAGHIAMAKDFGIVSGDGGDSFSPDLPATREQAAVMIMRMHRGLNKTNEYNGFYAIRSSSQMDFVDELDYVSFGWSRLELSYAGLTLNTSASGGNEYGVPEGWREPFDLASGSRRLLMVACEDRSVGSLPVSSAIVTDSRHRTDATAAIASAVNGIATDDGIITFDGVVLDLEGMKGEAARDGYTDLIRELRAEPSMAGKLLFVAVPPPRRPGLEYFDGYDYWSIAESADKIILMAHDYNAKRLTAEERSAAMTTTPLSPIDEVYYALRVLAGQVASEKLMLQLSFDTAQFKISDGAVVNEQPYTPDYDTLSARMLGSGVEFNYSKRYESPYITFYNNGDATDNIVWYEDERSVAAKLRLAKLFNITGVSLWRLGTIPDYPNDTKNIGLSVLSMLRAD